MRNNVFLLGLVTVAICLQYSFALTLLPKPIACPQRACKCPYGTIWITNSDGCEVCSCKPAPVECPLYKCAAIECPQGRQTDANGCPTCECKPVACPAIACFPQPVCPNGVATDERGCPTCRCKECLTVACKCPYGSVWTTDSNGCRVCSCNPPPPTECPLIKCPAIACPQGRQTDANGCQTCECKLIACPLIACFPKPDCPNGVITDEVGCPTCKCKPVACPRFRCIEDCPHGYVEDANGCPTCTCKPDPKCPPLICPAVEVFCPNGRGALDENGCETCACKPVCPLRKCVENCSNGYILDAQGCRTCTCKPAICQPLICPAVICPDGLGFESDKDENGCDINCRCKRRPENICPDFMCRFLCSLPERFGNRFRSCDCDCASIPPFSRLALA